MKKVALPEREGFQVSNQTRESFAGQPQFYRISGPGALMRLIQFGQTTPTGDNLGVSRFDGLCWLEERDYQTLRTGAIEQLSAELGPNGARPDLVQLHMKFSMREDFAVSQDWNLFDAFITFSFGARESFVALVGKTAAQPYYSKADPRHDSTDIKLSGMGNQYVIDFQFPANRHLADRIRGPFFIGSHVKPAKW